MIPRCVNHLDYDFSVLFALPSDYGNEAEAIDGDMWFDEPPVQYPLRVRECRLDEFSDYGFVIEPSSGRADHGRVTESTRGILLCDAVANPDGFVEALAGLPDDWNFGGLIAIDRRSRLAFSTNCSIAETPEWRDILAKLVMRDTVEATFSQSDVGVRVERREGDLVIQQTAWEVPAAWGPRGSGHYPVHRFINGDRCQQKLLRALDSYDELRRDLRRRGAPRQVTSRLGANDE